VPSHKPIRVKLGARAYDVTYLRSMGELGTALGDEKQRIALIDANVEKHFGTALRKNLANMKFIRIASGEQSKSFAALERVAGELVRLGANRRSELIAIGGGVVGDLTGFLAGVFMRGVSFVQVPTTLLAMVDSSVGGKTAVNIAAGKNLVGLFHQPRAVYVLPEFLKTLPQREIECGLSESIKTALIRDPKLVKKLESTEYHPNNRNIEFLSELSDACIRIKAEVVARDEREENIRAFLNFGHTLAHAIEAKARYKGILHGHAVAIGQRFAAIVSRRLGYLNAIDESRIENLLEKFALPRRLRKGDAPLNELVKHMRADKKNDAAGIRFVTLAACGKARLPELVREQELLASLKEFQSLRP